MQKIVRQRICCSSGARRVWAGEDKDISNVRLRPAKQTKLTYSLIAFNKDNASHTYRWDPEHRRRLRAPPQTGWHANKAGELIFNSKLWILNLLSQRLALPQQTFFFFLICSINGNSVPIKTSHPDEFNLRGSRPERRAAQRSVTMQRNKAAAFASINTSPICVCSPSPIVSPKTFPTLHSGNSDNSEVRSIWTISSLHKTSQLFFFPLAITQLLPSVTSLQSAVTEFTAKERWVKTNLAFKVRGSGFQHPDSIWSISNSIASHQPPFSTGPAEGGGRGGACRRRFSTLLGTSGGGHFSRNMRTFFITGSCRPIV